jgi:hypothetical protein
VALGSTRDFADFCTASRSSPAVADVERADDGLSLAHCPHLHYISLNLLYGFLSSVPLSA